MSSGEEPLVLVIEDEPALRRLLRVVIQSTPYRLLEAATGADGVSLAASHHPAMILLDLGLPDQEGLQVIEQIRSWSTVPILVLSARTQETDKVEALDAGADDYLTKPFLPLELLARIRAGLRRVRAPLSLLQEATWSQGDLRVDWNKRQVCKGEEEVHLTPIEYKMFHFLVHNLDRVVTYQQLIRAVWGEKTSATADHVRVHMFQLRHKLEDIPARPRFLLTETGVGYRFRGATASGESCAVR